jgi:hypothetical protein
MARTIGDQPAGANVIAHVPSVSTCTFWYLPASTYVCPDGCPVASNAMTWFEPLMSLVTAKKPIAQLGHRPDERRVHRHRDWAEVLGPTPRERQASVGTGRRRQDARYLQVQDYLEGQDEIRHHLRDREVGRLARVALGGESMTLRGHGSVLGRLAGDTVVVLSVALLGFRRRYGASRWPTRPTISPATTASAIAVMPPARATPPLSNASTEPTQRAKARGRVRAKLTSGLSAPGCSQATVAFILPSS